MLTAREAPESKLGRRNGALARCKILCAKQGGEQASGEEHWLVSLEMTPHACGHICSAPALRARRQEAGGQQGLPNSEAKMHGYVACFLI